MLIRNPLTLLRTVLSPAISHPRRRAPRHITRPPLRHSPLLAGLEARLLLSAAAKLVFGTPPADGFLGSNLPAVTVDVEDAGGQIVNTDASKVTIEIASGPNGGKLLGKFTVNAVHGVATFSNLHFSKTGQYTLKVTDGSLTSATSAQFTVNAARKATTLVFGQQPPATGIAGANLAPAITVKVLDQFGQVLTTDHSTVKLSIATGPTTKGTFTAHVTSGIATFSNLKFTRVGQYTLGASDGALTPVTSSQFTIAAGAAAQLAFTQTPANGSPHGNFTIKVQVEDQFGNLVTTDTSNVTLALKSGPAGVTLNQSIHAVAGVATFNPVALGSSGRYILKATDANLAPDTSAPFTLT